MRTRKKGIFITVLSLTIFLGIYSAVFFHYRNSFLRRFTVNMIWSESDGAYRKTIGQEGALDTIYCTAWVPHFFSDNQASLQFSQSTVTILFPQENDTRKVPEHFYSIIRFPRYFKKMEVFVSLDYYDENNEMNNVYFDLDEKMNFLNEGEVSNVQRELFENLRPRIVEIYRGIYETWGICKLEGFE